MPSAIASSRALAALLVGGDLAGMVLLILGILKYITQHPEAGQTPRSVHLYVKRPLTNLCNKLAAKVW